MDAARGQATVGNHEPGDVVGARYRILRVLGTGGVATTYAAEDPSGKQVALKQLFLWRRHDWKVFELFEREARVLSQISHPGIPRFIDFFQAETREGSCFYLAQELASGRTLKAWVESGFHPTEAFVRTLADQLLGILEYLHALHPPIVHRDIKPANLIWRADGTLAVVDFGAVRDSNRDGDDGSTIVGTYGFMAPEQFRGHAVPESDLYGVGATCAYLLSGRNPADLPEKNGQLVLNAANVSGALRTWTERLLARDPAARFASATEARAALKDTKLVPVRVGKSSLAVRTVGVSAAFLLALGLTFAGIALFVNQEQVSKPSAPEQAALTVSGNHEVSTGRVKWVKNFTGHWSALFDLTVDPTAAYLATASNDGTAKIWDLETGTILRSLTGHLNPRVGSVSITGDGKYVVTGSDLVRIFDLATGSLVRALTGHRGEVTSVSPSPDGTRIASTSMDATARIWDFATGKEQALFTAPKRCLSVAWSADGDRLAVGCDDAMIYVLDGKTGQRRGVFAGHTGPIDDVVYSSDGRTLVSASDDRTIRIWADRSATAIVTLTGHTDEVWGISLSPDGKTTVSGSKDQTIRLWDVYSGKQLDVTPSTRILKVRFLPDGERFVAAQGNGVAALFTLGQASWYPPKITSPVPHPPRAAPAGATEDEVLCLSAQQALDEAKPHSDYVAQSRRLAAAALQKNPRSALAHVVLARAEYRSGYIKGNEYKPASLERAHAELDQAIVLDPNLALAHLTRAYVYWFQGNLGKANENTARARQLDAKDPRVLLLLGALAFENKQYDEAFALARSVVETTRDPYYLDGAYDNLLDVFRRRRDWEAVENIHRSLVNIDAENAWKKGNFANYLNWRGKYDEAIDWATRAIAQADYGLVHVTLADAFAGKAIKLLKSGGPSPEVEGLVDQAERASPRSADAAYARGLWHRALGNSLRANLSFRAALTIEPDHERAKAALAGK